MTRRDYLLVAEGLKLALVEARKDSDSRRTMGVIMAANSLANRFEQTNRRFERQLFFDMIEGRTPIDR